MNRYDIRTDANYIEIRGNHNSSMFAPNFYSPDVWLTEDRLEVRYSLEHGFVVTITASITRTADGFTLVGAHKKYDGEVVGYGTTLRTVTENDTRLALLNEAAKVDALFNEFIRPQVLRALVLEGL